MQKILILLVFLTSVALGQAQTVTLDPATGAFSVDHGDGTAFTLSLYPSRTGDSSIELPSGSYYDPTRWVITTQGKLVTFLSPSGEEVVIKMPLRGELRRAKGRKAQEAAIEVLYRMDQWRSEKASRHYQLIAFHPQVICVQEVGYATETPGGYMYLPGEFRRNEYGVEFTDTLWGQNTVTFIPVNPSNGRMSVAVATMRIINDRRWGNNVPNHFPFGENGYQIRSYVPAPEVILLPDQEGFPRPAELPYIEERTGARSTFKKTSHDPETEITTYKRE